MANAIRHAASSGVSVVLAAQHISEGSVAGLLEPYPELATAGGSLGLVGVRPDVDGVLRRYLPYGRDKDGDFVFGLALVAVAEFRKTELPEAPEPNGNVILNDGLLAKVVDGQFMVNFTGPPGTHTTLVARDLLRAEQDFSDELLGKIVFIGVTDPSVEDVFATPFSGTNRMAGVEFHAAATDTLLQNSFITTTPRYLVVMIVITLGVLAISLGRFIKPLLGFSTASGMLAAVLGAWLGAFFWADHFFPLTAPLAAMITGYGLSLSDRVGVEQIEKQQARSMLSRYLPAAIVKEMLKNPLAAQLGGKRADLTVLFSDIRGFTSIAERLAPEEVVSLLNQYLTVMTEVIHRHGGTIDKFEGDAILAIFGAPQLHDDDAERAVRTAWEMRYRLRELESQWMDRTGSSLEIGIAVNTGQAVVGNIGSQKRMDYTAIGDAVNLASRLQELTKEYGVSILVSGSTYARVRQMCQAQFLGAVEIRGRRQLVDLYTLTGLEPGPSILSPGEVAGAPLQLIRH